MLDNGLPPRRQEMPDLIDSMGRQPNEFCPASQHGVLNTIERKPASTGIRSW